MALHINRRHRVYVPHNPHVIVVLDGNINRPARWHVANEGKLPRWLIKDLSMAMTGTIGELKMLYCQTHAPYRENALAAFTRLSVSGLLPQYRMTLEHIFKLRWNRKIYRFMSSRQHREHNRHLRIGMRHTLT